MYIGDSISSNVDFGALGVTTQSEFVKVKAYSSVFDKVSNVAKQAARFPAANFTDVVPAELNKGRFNTLVLQAGSVDITNLNTKDNPKEYMEYFRQETILSAQNIFRAATNALRAHPNLSKVVIMSQIPRYDTPHVDPLSLKSSLFLVFNTSLTNLWMEFPDKERIHVGRHNIDCNGAIREARYRHTKSGKFDGIHLLGSSGQKAYTLSVLNIFKAAGIISSENNYHQSCAQFKYQNRPDKTQKQWRKSRDQKAGSRMENQFSVPTYNRFEELNNLNQGKVF